MKKMLPVMALAVALLSTTLLAQTADTGSTENGSDVASPDAAGTAPATTINLDRYKYVVRRGDTLWALAGQFLDNPFDWPMIWQDNPHIEDPHWIYPGDILTIIPEWEKIRMKRESLPVTSLGSAEAAGIEEAAVVLYGVEKNYIVFTPAKLMGFLSLGDLKETAGAISGSPLQVYRNNYGALDRVYINIGSENGVQLGDNTADPPRGPDKFTVFRKVKMIKHPVTGKKVGYQIRTLATLKVIAVYPKISTAEITYSNEDIHKGDLIMPFANLKKEVYFADVAPKYQDQPLEAHIIMNRDNQPYMGREEIAYIDVGKKDDVLPGNLFSIYKSGKMAKNPDTGKKLQEPDEIIGELVVLLVGETTSTVLIIQAIEEIAPGERLRSHRYE